MKVNVIMTKEAFDNKQSTEDIVVVLDVLLATSTIVTCLSENARAVYPIVRESEVNDIVDELTSQYIKRSDIIIAGEKNAKKIANFTYPFPSLLQKRINNKHLILLTTNGTRAIRMIKYAKEILIASLLNTKAVANWLVNEKQQRNVTIVCAGSAGSYCMEDFYGAGFLIYELLNLSKQSIQLSDSALTARLFYQSYKKEAQFILSKSNVGKLLNIAGYQSEIEFVSRKNVYDIVPIFNNNRIN